MSASGASGGDSGHSGWPGSTRRDRLERIAKAERDRRAGRGALARATLGEASEWPARAVAALIRLEEADAQRAREVLEEGLDRWAMELGLGALDAEAWAESSSAAPPPTPGWALPASDDGLDAPLAASELDRAFEEAEARTEEMHDVNQVAARVLMDEPIGLAELSGEEGPDASWLESSGLDASQWDAAAEEGGAPSLGAAVDGTWAHAEGVAAAAPGIDAAWGPSTGARAAGSSNRAEAGGTEAGTQRAVVLATLERWLGNLQRRRAGRT